VTNSPQDGVDLSNAHAELDKLKSQLCRCQHQGTCLACRGFEVLRQQLQVVVAAASQPVLMQVAQEVAVKDLMTQLTGLQEKLAEDPQLQELMARLMDRVQDDLGGAENLQRMLSSLFGTTGFPGSPDAGDVPPDDRNIPPDDRPAPGAGKS
jgi:excinuclease UvrABC ATPase subunit